MRGFCPAVDGCPRVRTRTTDRRATLAHVLLLATVGLTGCVQPSGVPGTSTLSNTWMLGIERMRNDPEPQLPFTNRFIADLAAMPRTQVVFVSTDRNNIVFNAWSSDKVLVSPWLHAEGNCMNLTYTIFQAGQQQGAFGQVVPRRRPGPRQIRHVSIGQPCCSTERW
jgi:hypothetical protein